MVRPNYRDYRRSQFVFGSDHQLMHSAKGSEWEDHLYIKRIDGTYYYPDSYKGGRHLPKGESGSDRDKMEKEENGSTKVEYRKGDPDFDDKNFDEKNRLGDTDFFGFIGENGNYVIIEEDMKWELPPGTEITPELITRLEQFEQRISDLRKDDDLEKVRYSNEQWETWAKEAIDGSSNDLSDNDVDNLAKEVIRGNFGNGQQRKDLLGENYDKIQQRVNEMMKGSTGQKKVSSASKGSIKKAEAAASKVGNNSVKAALAKHNEKKEFAKRSSKSFQKTDIKLPSLPKRK